MMDVDRQIAFAAIPCHGGAVVSHDGFCEHLGIEQWSKCLAASLDPMGKIDLIGGCVLPNDLKPRWPDDRDRFDPLNVSSHSRLRLAPPMPRSDVLASVALLQPPQVPLRTQLDGDPDWLAVECGAGVYRSFSSRHLRLQPELDKSAHCFGHGWLVWLFLSPTVDRGLKLNGHSDAHHGDNTGRWASALFLIINN